MTACHSSTDAGGNTLTDFRPGSSWHVFPSSHPSASSGGRAAPPAVHSTARGVPRPPEVRSPRRTSPEPSVGGPRQSPLSADLARDLCRSDSELHRTSISEGKGRAQFATYKCYKSPPQRDYRSAATELTLSATYPTTATPQLPLLAGR